MAEQGYLDLDLAVTAQGPGYLARVVASPAGDASAAFTLPFTDGGAPRVAVGPSRRVRPAAAAGTATRLDPEQFGSTLYDAVFAGDVGRRFEESLRIARREGRALRLRLDLTGAPDLDSLPWEYLYSPSLLGFLALSTDTPVVRQIATAVPAGPVPVTTPLRVLVMVSSPTGVPPLDVDREVELLRATTADLTAAGVLETVFLDRATLVGLQHQLYQRFNVFHFIGHGQFDPARGKDAGALVLEGAAGGPHLVTGAQLGTFLRDAADLQLVVLNACEGARSDSAHGFGGVAQNLVRRGLPAVVAMQDEISDVAALAFAHEFYYALAAGRPLADAVTEARKGIYASDRPDEWVTPVLLRSGDGDPFRLVVSGDARRPSAQDRREAMTQAAARALDADRPRTAAPLLQQLHAERPGDEAVTGLLSRMPDPAVRLDTGMLTEPGGTPLGGPPGSPPPGPPGSPPPGTAPRRSGRTRVLAAAGVLAVAVAGASFLVPRLLGSTADADPTAAPTAGQGAGPTPAATPVAGGAPSPTGGGAPSPTAGGAGAACPTGPAVQGIDRPAVVAACLPTAPVVDTQLEDWPAVEPTVVSAAVAGIADPLFFATMQLGWTPENLYLVAAVSDLELTFAGPEPSAYWQGDGISFELGPDVRGLDPATPARPQDIHLMLGLVDPGAVRAGANRGPTFSAGRDEPQVEAAVRFTGVGYVVEARVPWEVLGVTDPAPGHAFGLNLDASDREPGGGLRAMVSSNPDRTAQNQARPATWDLLVLAGPAA